MIVFLIGIWLSWRISFDWFTRIALSTLVYVSVVIVQVCGLILCFVGYRKNESVSFNLILNIFLILWGSLVTWWALVWYAELLEWSSMQGVRSLTIWDHAEYATSALRGLLWISSGLVFTAISYVRKPSKSKPEID